MLRNVLGDYLDRLRSERAFDAPFQALLGSMGFYDVHFTHGSNEMGKDFIAKRAENGRVVQWSFQTKRGDISLPDWRNQILGQMKSCELTGLHHPHFDRSIPCQSALVCTGVLTERVNAEVVSFGDALSKEGCRPLEVWSKPKLIDFFIAYGLSALQGSIEGGATRFGPFYTLYGRAISAELELEHVEAYSRTWIREEEPATPLVLSASLESAILSSQCKTTVGPYEALICELAALRAICFHWFAVTADQDRSNLASLHASQLRQILSTCWEVVDTVRGAWESSERDLGRAIRSSALFVMYPVWCQRAMEAAALAFILETDPGKRSEAHEFLAEFVQAETGCSRPISNRYTISIVLATLALCAGGRPDAAKELIKQTCIWICDRAENGWGLASVDDTVDDEVIQLLGYPFDTFKLTKVSDSTLACALCDLSAFLGDSALYADVVNDILACDICPSVWQCLDTKGQFVIDAEDVVQYPNVEFDEPLSPFSEFNYAQHVRKEPRTFALFGERGIGSFMCIAMFLRDRYFPTLWGGVRGIDEVAADMVKASAITN